MITSTFDERMRRGGDMAVRELGRFFMKEGEVYQSLRRITAKLESLDIPYCVVGGMALVAHGYVRGTVDVDLLVTPEGLKATHEALDGLGYVPPFKGSKQLRDAENGVRVEFLVTGQFPGDGKPKPIAFPDPTQASVSIDGIRYLSLPTLVELKLASGLTNPQRLKDLVDVMELIRLLNLPSDFSQNLNPYVQPKFDELWQTVQTGSYDL